MEFSILRVTLQRKTNFTCLLVTYPRKTSENSTRNHLAILHGKVAENKLKSFLLWVIKPERAEIHKQSFRLIAASL